MSAIGSIGSEEPSSIDSVEPPAQERVGQALFWSAVGIACCTFPAGFQKKRVRHLTPIPSFETAPPLVEQVEPEEPRPVPQCTAEEQAKIRTLFEAIARPGMTHLIKPWEGFRLHRLGQEIESVHPFSFLLALPKELIRAILQERNSFKLSRVMGGIAEKMEREQRLGNLEPFLDSFAAAMHVPLPQIRQLIQASDWRVLVEYLFDRDGAHEACRSLA